MPSKSYKVFVGLDPGKKGGLCRIIEEQPLGIIYIEMKPMLEDVVDIWEWFAEIDNLKADEIYAVIEKVWAYPKQGVTSCFSFGFNYGVLNACLAASIIPEEDITIVTPKLWQKGYLNPKKGEPKAEHKERLRSAAQKLYPEEEVWHQKRNLGEQRAVCDALLLADYCRRINSNACKP